MSIRSRNLPFLKKKKNFLSQKNKLGLSLNRKKGLFGQKVNAYVILEQLLNYKIPPFHCLSEANAWASVHALSMVTLYHQNIVDLLTE